MGQQDIDTAEKGGPPQSGSGQQLREKYLEKLIDIAVLTLPTLMIQAVYKQVVDRWELKPWHSLWLVVPLGAIAIVIWKRANRRRLKLNRRYSVFLVVFVSLFSAAAYSELLVWNRNVTLLGQEIDRTWLAPTWAGDWRYSVAPRKPLKPRDIMVVMMEQANDRTLETLRQELTTLIAFAANQGALGIALDFYFPDETRSDSAFCAAIERAKAKGLDVFVGYELQRIRGEIRSTPPAPTLVECLPEAARGHLVGLRDLDLKVRLLPLYLDAPSGPALSLRAAESLAKHREVEISLPQDGRLRFIAPKEVASFDSAIPVLRFQELLDDPDLGELFKGCFLLVGRESNQDTFSTPFGILPGALVHAFAVHSLAAGHYLSRAPWWTGTLATLFCCYLITVWVAENRSTRSIAVRAILLSFAIIIASLLGTLLWLVWSDVVYSLMAIWLLTGLMLPFRRTLAIAK